MKRRPLDIKEARSLGMFYKNMPIASIEHALEEGSLVELEESMFKDSDDYVKVLIDGTPIFYAEGY